MESKIDISQHKLIVRLGKGTLKNPFIPAVVSKLQAKQYKDFAQLAKDNEFWTDAPDGEYSGSEFGDEVWQFFPLGGLKWINTDFSYYDIYKDFEEFSKFYQNAKHQTRRFRPYLPKPDSITKPGEETHPNEALEAGLNHIERIVSDKFDSHYVIVVDGQDELFISTKEARTGVILTANQSSQRVKELEDELKKYKTLYEELDANVEHMRDRIILLEAELLQTKNQ